MCIVYCSCVVILSVGVNPPPSYTGIKLVLFFVTTFAIIC